MDSILKIGLIRCMQTEDICPATTDFKYIHNNNGAFEGIEGAIEKKLGDKIIIFECSY